MLTRFSTAVAARLTGASIRQIGHWAETGLLKPSARAASGRGSKRQYTFQDLVALATIFRLRQGGCSLQQIRTAIKYLKAHYPDEADARMLSRLTLLTDGAKVYLLTDQGPIMEVVTRRQVWAVPLGLLITEMRQKVDALPHEWTEEVRIRGSAYHLEVAHDGEAGGYVVQCKELPGALEQGQTPEEAIANGKDAIRSVLTYMHRQNRRAARHKHVATG